ILAAMRGHRDHIAAAIGTVDGLTPRRLPDPVGAGGSSLTWFAPDAPTARRFVDALRAERLPAAQMYDGQPVYANAAILERRTRSMRGGPWHCNEPPCHVEYRMGMCPNTEDLAARSITVGIGPRFTADDCDDIAAGVRKVAHDLLGSAL